MLHAVYIRDLTEIHVQLPSDTLTVRRIRQVEVANLAYLDVMRHRLHRISEVTDEPTLVIRCK